MNLNILRLSGIALLAMLITVSACGKKGDPIRPGEEAKLEEQELFE
jgi:hypothetical protein